MSCLAVVYTLYLFVRRPYKHWLSNIGIIVNQLTVVIVASVTAYLNITKNVIPPSAELYYMFVLMALLSLVAFLSILRTVLKAKILYGQLKEEPRKE